MGCAIGTVKYLVFIFNLIFAIAGLAILVIGILVKVSFKEEIFRSEELDMNIAALVFIVIGAIIFLIAFFGCCGAIRESSCMLTTYAVILLGLFILQLAIGIFVFVVLKDKEPIYKLVGEEFEDDIKKYNDGNREIQVYFDHIQQENQCCGAKGPDDWKWANQSVPLSCCQDKITPCTPDATHVFRDGCSEKVFNKIVSHSKTIGFVAFAVAATEVIGAFFALCLASSIRNHYRRGVYA